MAKKAGDDLSTWDLFLNQTLAAVRFSVSESTKFSPFYLLYTRDVVLPLDNILRPRRRYLEVEPHQLQEQHRVFSLVQQRLRKAKKRRAKYADRDSKPVEVKVGDEVVIEKLSPVTFRIKNQL